MEVIGEVSGCGELKSHYHDSGLRTAARMSGGKKRRIEVVFENLGSL